MKKDFLGFGFFVSDIISGALSGPRPKPLDQGFPTFYDVPL